MPQNYDLKVDNILIGTLNAPKASYTSRTNAMATFTPVGGTITHIPRFDWSNFSVNLSAPVNGLPSGIYTFSTQDTVIKGTMIAPNRQTSSWQVTPTSAEGRQAFNLYVDTILFGLILPLGQAPRFTTPDQRNTQNLQELHWDQFNITLTTTYGSWPASSNPYQFNDGHFTKITGQGFKPHGPRTEPSTWEATTQIVR